MEYQFASALEMLLSRRFNPWEGGEGLVSSQYVWAHLLLGRHGFDGAGAHLRLVRLLRLVAQVRALRQDMLVVSRARDADHARHLYQIGVTDAVPETIEASLLLSEAALIGLGVAMGLVVASIHERREEFRHELQQAAGGTRPAGETTGVRRKPSD